MTKDDFKVLVSDLVNILKNSGYTYRESGDILITAGVFISEVRDDKQNK